MGRWATGPQAARAARNGPDPVSAWEACAVVQHACQARRPALCIRYARWAIGKYLGLLAKIPILIFDWAYGTSTAYVGKTCVGHRRPSPQQSYDHYDLFACRALAWLIGDITIVDIVFDRVPRFSQSE